MTTQPGTYDFTIYKGATFNEVVTWNDQNGNPINLTGYTAQMEARAQIDSVLPFLTLSTGSGITLGGSAGTITIYASPATTASITDNDGVYDLELTDTSGNVTRLLQGHMYISNEVTR